MVPVVRAAVGASMALRAAEAVLAGGISVFEITMTVPGAVAVIATLSARFGDRALVGAGTVLSAEDALRLHRRRRRGSSSAPGWTCRPSRPRTRATCR